MGVCQLCQNTKEDAIKKVPKIGKHYIQTTDGYAESHGDALNSKEKVILLIGGGLSNVQVIKMLRTLRPTNCKVILISGEPTTWYNGMLPSCISKVYNEDEI